MIRGITRQRNNPRRSERQRTDARSEGKGVMNGLCLARRRKTSAAQLRICNHSLERILRRCALQNDVIDCFTVIVPIRLKAGRAGASPRAGPQMRARRLRPESLLQSGLCPACDKAIRCFRTGAEPARAPCL